MKTLISRASLVIALATVGMAFPAAAGAVALDSTANVVATKIVCNDESDLPNWGTHNGPDITSTTATDFLATHPNCYAQSGWTFQWAPEGTDNPGDNTDVAGSPWVSSVPTDENGVTTMQVPSVEGLTWFRESLQEGFIQFTGSESSDNVSAEMYCDTDHLYYDNFDWIFGAQPDTTYYCVAFNAPTVPVDVCTNLEGNQLSVPEGMTENEGVCSTPEENTPTDVCSNIDGNQSSVPEGMTESDGVCTEIPTHHGGGGGGSACAPGTAYSPTEGKCVPTTTGQVLGVSCGLYMDKHIKLSSPKNDPDQVKKLQTFLNKWMGSSLPITGTYDQNTLNIVNAFQAKYSAGVLSPWGIKNPTGIVYLSTLRQINLLECPDLTIPMPTLVDWNKNPNAQ